MFLEAGIFSLQVILQSGQKETLTASLEMQRTRYIFVYTLKERCYSINPVAMLHCFFCHQHESEPGCFTMQANLTEEVIFQVQWQMLRTQMLQLQHLMHRSNLKRSYFFTEKRKYYYSSSFVRKICHLSSYLYMNLLELMR